MVIKELVLLTNDLTATEEFYSNILGFTVCNKSGTQISFSVGHTILSFFQTKETTPFYHFAFSIPSNKVDEAHAFVASKIPILPFTPGTTIADFSNWNAHAFYFYDNQNDIVEFIAHHDLRNEIDAPFTASAIIGICEIGVPAEDVTEMCQKLNEQHRVPYYTKGPRLHDFSVLGDEQGLFIVTKIGRGWLPTQEPAEQHFTDVLFENNNVESHFVFGTM